jgi:hypothetical protein
MGKPVQGTSGAVAAIERQHDGIRRGSTVGRLRGVRWLVGRIGLVERLVRRGRVIQGAPG